MPWWLPQERTESARLLSRVSCLPLPSSAIKTARLPSYLFLGSCRITNMHIARQLARIPFLTEEEGLKEFVRCGLPCPKVYARTAKLGRRRAVSSIASGGEALANG